MWAIITILLASLSVIQATDTGYAVPFSAGSPDFSVAVINQQVSVICSATVAVTCQAVKMQDYNQTTLGLPKTIDMYHEYYDVETIATSNGTLLVCYATDDAGATCVQMRVDPNFGLMGDPYNPLTICTDSRDGKPEICGGISLAATDDSSKFAICYDLNGDQGACNMLTLSGQVTSERLLVLNESWSLSPAALSKVPNGPLVLCVVTDNPFAIEDANCRTLDSTTLQLLPTRPLELGPASIISATYVGRTPDKRDRLTVCYLSTDTQFLYCAAVYVLNGNLFVSSRSAFAAKYTGLNGLRVLPLSKDPASLAAMGCLATIEEGPQELVCSLISTTSAGVITVDQNEMVVDENGFYYQNVPQALNSVMDVGAYLQQSLKVSARSSSSDGPTAPPSSQDDTPYISEVTVLPDFLNVFPAAAKSGGSMLSVVSSVGCVNMGLNDLDEARFCIGTAAKLQTPPPPPPPFPPSDYCTVTKPWECDARKDYCAMVNAVCTSKWACSTQKTPTGCTSLIQQGGQCKFENGACLPTYDWDPQSMCQTVTRSSLCNGSPGCVWAANACRPKPYCQLPNRQQCRASPGCVWLGKQCGTSTTAL